MNLHATDRMGLGMTSQRARDRLVERLRAEGIRDHRVLKVIGSLPRHLFIEEALGSRAYEDTALPIGQGQTISQPWVVARMTEALLEHGPRARVLEIGTGSGYQAAVLAPLVEQVYTVERIGSLLRLARRRLHALNIGNVRARHEDGAQGWSEAAPFDGIIVTAAGAAIEPDWIEQLAPDGVLVAPVGPPSGQRLVRLRRTPDGVSEEDLGGVSFVPLRHGLGS